MASLSLPKNSSAADHTPLVSVTEIDPSAILVEHDDRNENEILVDPALLPWHQIILDDGRPSEFAFDLADMDDDGGSCVRPEALLDWRAARARHAAKIHRLNAVD